MHGLKTMGSHKQGIGIGQSDILRGQDHQSPGNKLNILSSFEHTGQPVYSRIRIAPADLSSDEVFLRRAFIDITGTFPGVDDYHRFMGDTSPEKRARLIDSLLERKEFVELWVMKWAELLQVRSSNRVSYKAMLLYYNWIQERLVRCRVFLSVGTSGVVYPAAGFVRLARQVGARCIEVNPKPSGGPFDEVVPEGSETALPRIVESWLGG